MIHTPLGSANHLAVYLVEQKRSIHSEYSFFPHTYGYELYLFTALDFGRQDYSLKHFLRYSNDLPFPSVSVEIHAVPFFRIGIYRTLTKRHVRLYKVAKRQRRAQIIPLKYHTKHKLPIVCFQQFIQ